MRRQAIHAANIGGIWNLYREQDKHDYLCCSSLDCPDFFHRDVLFLVEGEVAREYWGDIGSIGMSPKRTSYDEVHIEGEFDILAFMYRMTWNSLSFAVMPSQKCTSMTSYSFRLKF